MTLLIVELLMRKGSPPSQGTMQGDSSPGSAASDIVYGARRREPIREILQVPIMRAAEPIGTFIGPRHQTRGGES